MKKFVEKGIVCLFIKVLFFVLVKSVPVSDIGVRIPDPLSFPDEYEFSNFFCTMKASDNQITGFSELRLELLSADFSDLSVQVEAKVPLLTVLGSAALATGIMFSFSSQYNITFNNATFYLSGQVIFDQGGALQMSEEELKLNATYEDLQVTITELLWIPEYVHEIVVDQLMPTLLDQTEQWILQFINESFKSPGFLTQFPDSVHFIDYLLMQARPQIRKSGMDPLSFDNTGMELDLGLLLQCEDVALKGLSSLYWGHKGLFTYIENTFQLAFQIRTQTLKMKGRCGMTIVPLLESSLEILVDHIEISVEIHLQSSLESPPTLRLLEIDIGNIEAKVPGLGNLSYIAEAALDIVPNLSRDRIRKMMQRELWTLLQRQLNQLEPLLLIREYMKQQDSRNHTTSHCPGAAVRGDRCSFLHLLRAASSI
ncbi:uncharacterized protein [Macrobrachium rosenbergii]|uniref:uncharacterized protein isoform X1 n=1 Tax=Macrobrachium rosenbergii TaxID=79674 RepID=UPI0034D70C34